MVRILGMVSAAILLLTTQPVFSQTTGLRQQILELNAITGHDVVTARIKTLIDKPDQAKKLITEAVLIAKEKDTPLSYTGGLILGTVASELKEFVAAETLLRLCTGEAAKLQSTKKLLESYGSLIDTYYDNKKYDDAARICKELIDLKTDDGKPRIVLMAVTTRFGDTDFIEDDAFDSAKRLRPGVHRLLIQATSKQGKYDQALKLVDGLIKTNDHWMERQLKGWVLREAGKFEEAAKIYEDVLVRIGKDANLPEDDRDDYAERYRYALSSIYIDMKKVDLATEQLEKLLEKKPNDPGYNNDLGYIWADHDMKLAEAEKLIRKALELDKERRIKLKVDGENGAYLDSLGWVLFKQKKLNEAKDALLRAIEDKGSQHIEIYDHLGDVYMALGDRESAVKAWRRGLELVGEGRREADRKAAVEKKLAAMK